MSGDGLDAAMSRAYVFSVVVSRLCACACSCACVCLCVCLSVGESVGLCLYLHVFGHSCVFFSAAVLDWSGW